MNLLRTKFALPALRPSLVSRPRLVARLDAGLTAVRPEIDRGAEVGSCFARKLTLISAPAGFGKSTLVRAWIEQRRTYVEHPGTPALAVAWLALDRNDDDVTRFWTYALAAIQTASPDLALPARSLLQPTDLGPGEQTRRMESFLTALINDLAAFNGCLLWVLDDYHVIENGAIHQGLTFLLDHLPAQVHLVIAARADPPLPLSRLRGRNEMMELRAADLAFTIAETADFFSAAMSLDLSDTALTALAAKTEGWVTGLQMAALALRSAAVPEAQAEAFIASLAQTQRYLLDYMADEVLAQQPAATQTFLLRTSILDRLSGPLCDALLADPTVSGAEMLRRLDRSSLFIAPIDETLLWYRYHPLFAELLQIRLSAQQPDLAATLHQRASAWYEGAGMPEAAIDHALHARSFDRAAVLIEDEIGAELAQSENATVLRWIESLPDDHVRAHPRLCVAHAWALLVHGRSPEIVQRRLSEARQGDATPESRGAAAALQAILDIYRGDLSAAVAHATKALLELPVESAFFRSTAANTLGIAHTSTGNLPAATTAFETVATTAQATGNLMMAVIALSNLAGLQVLQGQLHQAEDNYRQALALSTGARGHRLPVAARALLGLGELARERNDLAAARSHLTEACDLSRRHGEIGTLICLLTLARVEQEAGDLRRAYALFSEAESLAAASRATQLDDRLVATARVQLWLAERDLARANAWAQPHRSEIPCALAAIDTRGDTPLQGDYNLLEAEAITLARVEIALGHPDAALELLKPLAQTATRLGRTRRRVELLVLASLAHQRAGRIPDAHAALQQALTLAAPEGYIRTFLDGNAPLLDLLTELHGSRAMAAGPIPAYVAELIRQAGAADGAQQGPDTRQSPAPDQRPALTPREIDVLHLISQGYANREIGQKLFIALDTVKGHTREIYAKLDVHSRTQAVTRARELGLLSA